MSQYILSLSAAGLLCTLLIGISSKKGTHQHFITFLCGICMLITTISPLKTFCFTDIRTFTGQLQIQSEDAVKEGQQMAQTAMADIIKSQSEAYILDRASALGLTLQVQVKLQESAPYAPESVTLHGQAAPLAKTQLTTYIQDTLSIPKEKQIWT